MGRPRGSVPPRAHRFVVMPDAAADRKFSEEEVALIIKRAAEMQSEQVEQSDTGHALTLSEVEDIAKEAGIDSRLIRRAAQSLDHHTETSNRPSPWLGAPTQLVFETVVDGEIGPDDHEALVNEMRRTFADNGVPSVLGRTLAWTSMPAGGRRNSRGRNIDISVIARGGVTTIRIEEELGNVAAPLFAGLIAGGGGGTTGLTVGLAMAATGSAALAGVLWVVVAGGFYALSRGIFKGVAAKRERQLRELMSRLAAHVRESVELASTRRLDRTSAGRTSLPANESLPLGDGAG